MRVKVVALIIAIATVLTGCGNANNGGDATDTLAVAANMRPTLQGVSLTTELEYYAEGSARVLAFWDNGTGSELYWGEGWLLDKYDFETNTWVTYRESVPVFLSRYVISPEGHRKHTYDLTIYEDYITEGYYRVRTSFSVDDDAMSKLYDIAAGFIVTRDTRLLKKSELDYDDLANSRELAFYSYFPVHVYKNVHTYNTTIVINGDEYYAIAEGNGRWGAVSCLYYEVGDNKYLAYSYSRKGNSGEHLSYIGVFDLIEKREIYRSEAYEGCDIRLGHRSYDLIWAQCGVYAESRNGGSNWGSVQDLGFLYNRNGEFRFWLFD